MIYRNIKNFNDVEYIKIMLVNPKNFINKYRKNF